MTARRSSKTKITQIEKRTGQVVDFDQSKITQAIYKALTATRQGDGKKAQRLSNKVVDFLNRRFKKDEIPKVEEIQDIVEEVLILEGYTETAKAYILYREQRRRIREAVTTIDEAIEMIDKYIQELDWEVKENANMAYSLQGLNHYVTSAVAKKYWLNKIYPQEIREAVHSGDFHIHNLDTLATYCCGWDLYDLLVKGFGGVAGKVESKPARHLRTALGQVVNFLYTLQGETAGAVAFSNFDTLLAPFIRYDQLNYHQVKQAVQEFLFNCAIPTRVGFQTPFSNVTLDIKPSPTLANQPVIVGGQPKRETYGEFQEEMNIFNRAFYEGLMEGDAKQRVFTFPIPTVNITKDFDWDDLNLEPMWEATAKYGVNYFANFIHSDMKPEDVRSMCFPATTKIIYKEGKHSRYQRTTIRNLVNNWNPKKEFHLLINGEWVKIRDSFKLKNTSGKIVIVTLKNGEVIKMTPDHPAMVIENGKLKQVSAKDLKKGDLIPIAKKGYQGGLGDFELGRWLGLYISEGAITKENTVYFSFNQKEKELQEFVKEIAEKRFAFPVHITKDSRWETIQVWVKSRAAVEWVRKFCSGKAAIKKCLLSPLFGMSKDFRLGALVGIYQGDGYERDVEFHTTNKKLRDDIADLARSVGINYTKRINQNNTKGENQFTSYVLRLCRDNLKSLVPHFKNIKASTSSIYKDFGEFYGIKIKSIKIQNYNVSVYDFEVDSKEHLFQLANGVITHNCCRLRLSNKELYKRGGGLFGSNPLTGSTGVVTINLPRLGYLSKTKKEFFRRLGQMMDLAKESLEIKRKALEDFIEKGLYPYSRYYLEGVKKMRGRYYGNHFSTIGLVGMNEALLNFIGQDIASGQGMKFAAEVLDFMRERLIHYQETTGNLYNLEATPAEGTSYRLAKKDKEEYPDIITAGKKEPYYTNSTQLPVGYTDDLFKALKLQDELQTKYTGGCIEKGNKVLTDKGLLNIENIVKDFKRLKPIKALSYNSEQGISEWDEIIDAVVIDVQKHNKIRIKGERNLDIVTSDWHPFFVLERVKVNPSCPICEEKVGNIKGFASHLRWRQQCREDYQLLPKYQVIEKRADELQAGDYILQNAHNLYPEGTSELNDDLMWLIGFFVGDGCISKFFDNRGGKNLRKHKVRFFSEHQEALRKVAAILQQYFNCQATVIRNEKRSKSLKEVSTSRKEVLEFFFRYGFQAGKKAYNISIPEKIKENITKNNVLSLLSGFMDSDGHIGKRDGDFEYYTVSSRLADDILEIYNIAGIMVSKTKKPTKRKNEVAIYRLRIPQYQMTKVKDRLTSVVNPSRIKESLSNRKKRHLPVVRVQEVSKTDVQDNQFYDLTTRKNHNYLAGKDALVFIHNTVVHAFLGERISDSAAVKALIKKVFEKFHLPYFTLTPTFSICPNHGYIKGEHFKCPHCVVDQPCEVYSRIVGYLRPVQQWHVGKREEFAERKTFKV